MSRFLMFVGMTLGGYLGWWLGGHFHLAATTTLVVISVSSVVGVFLGWKVGHDYFEG